MHDFAVAAKGSVLVVTRRREWNTAKDDVFHFLFKTMSFKKSVSSFKGKFLSR